jgi:hypothetical protein
MQIGTSNIPGGCQVTESPSDPARASVLLAPVAAARHAVIYRSFLDNIEPSEQPYHRADPAKWLMRMAALVRESDRRGNFVGSGDS